MARPKPRAADFYRVVLSRPVTIGRARIMPRPGLILSAEAVKALKSDKAQAAAVLKAEPVE